MISDREKKQRGGYEMSAGGAEILNRVKEGLTGR